MDEGIDTGDCILQRWVAIEPDDDSASLAARLAEVGAPLLAESLRLAHAGQAPRSPQDLAAGSYARKLAKEDGIVDWGLDAVTVWNRQRAVTPWPGAMTGFHGRRLFVIQCRPEHRLPVHAAPGTVLAVEAAGISVACAPGALRVMRVKPEGKAEMTAVDWARGARIGAGEVLRWEKEVLA
jgi:methionyl-tRNA formyltransferase